MAFERSWLWRPIALALLAATIILASMGSPAETTVAQESESGGANSPAIIATTCSPREFTSNLGPEFVVSVEELNLRSGPGTTCEIVAKLSQGDRLALAGEAIERDGHEWVPVSTEHGNGFVITQSIHLATEEATCGAQGEFGATIESGFTSDTVNLRSGPGLGCAAQAVLSNGTPVQVHGSAIAVDGEMWLPVSTPLGDGYIVQRGYSAPGSWSQPVAVAVLMYHDISENYSRFVVAPWQLEQQLIWLRDNGYTSITPRDLVANLDRGTPLPPRPVILSVDDGRASAGVFRDLLSAYGFKGTYFLPNYAELTPNAIYDLNRSGEVCGHSVSHPFLDQLSFDAQWYEIVENKAWLDSLTGTSTTCFAYPFGAFNETTTQIVIDAGYQIAFHAWDGVQQFDYLDRWHITRIEVSGEWDLSIFASAVSF